MPESLSGRDFQNLKSALDEAAIIAITDKHGVITYVNKKFCAISKYSAEELIGKTHKVINSGLHTKEFFADMWETIKSGKVWAGEIRNRAKDGTFYWVDTTIVPFMDASGHPESYVAVRYEITDRVLAQEQIADERENFRNLFNSTFEGIIVHSQGRILDANRAVCDIFKGSKEEIVGKNLNSFFRSDFHAEIAQQLAAGRDLRMEAVGLGLDQREIYLAISSRTVNTKGRWASLLAIRDLTERKLMEMQILQQDRLASLGLLASSLAHEIGTPLGVIRGRAEQVQKNADEKIKNTMSLIISQIDRISKLVNSLLHIARGRNSTATSEVNPNAVLNDVLELLSHEIQRNGIDLDISIREGLLVRAEAGPLGQVFLNLLVNAVHAILAVKEQRKRQIKIVALESDHEVRISVEDTGTGIEEKNFSRLFQPFFTTKEIGEGTGLGLATSYKIVNSWGGTIEVESKIGHGSKFTVILPS